MTHIRSILIVLLCVSAGVASAQDVVPVGKGSYASAPPASAGKAKQIATRTDQYVVDLAGRPIPTNRTWSHLLNKGKGADLWMYPMNVHVEADNVKLFYANSWGKDGKVITELPLKISADGLKPPAVKVKDWSDWLVSFRMGESADKCMDFTIGEGLPSVWIECNGVTPIIEFGDKPGAPSPTFFDKSGTPGELSASGDCVGLTFGGRSYGIFAPDGTKFSSDGKKLSVAFAGKQTFLVVSALPKPADIAEFYKHGFAIPRNSEVSWKYVPAAGEVATTWTITTDLLKGNEHGVIQGFIPHHYRKTKNDLKFAGVEYPTVRGTMKCATGTQFTLTYPFHGFLPFLPAPTKTGLKNDFDPDRMKQYLAMTADKTKYGDDTYWGAKNFLQMGHYLAMAEQLNDTAAADKLRASMSTALSDWFTYTPDEKAHYFARYDNWKALIGFKPSFGSEEFTDNHFHYGYFATSAANLGFSDPQFLADYGGMAKLVAKQYANWDRKDGDFPMFRTFDLWAGHGWAGGSGSPGGNNQESSSEAVQSWAGLFLLGNALDDKEMIAAGAMGYAMEVQATLEYWFDLHGDVWPKTYNKGVVGMVWSGGQVYGTWFSGDPAWIFGIQWLPWSPALSYLSSDPKFFTGKYDFMMAERQKKEKKPDLATAGSGLGNVLLTYLGQNDPDRAAALMDELWQSNNPIAKENDTGGMAYYWTHSKRSLGQQQFDYHLSVPTSAVFYNEHTQKTTYVAYNPKAVEQRAEVYKDGKNVGTIVLPPRQLTSVTSLKP